MKSPILRGRDIKRYGYSFADLWLINTHNGIRDQRIPAVDVNNYPAIKAHLDKFYPHLARRQDKGVTPYNLRNCAYTEVFFSPENPYDFDELLQNPMQQFMKEAEGEESKAGVSSKKGLNKETIVQISHAVAAHGDDAKARILKSEDGIAETVRLKKKINGAYIEITEEALKIREQVFKIIKEKYKQIRG